MRFLTAPGAGQGKPVSDNAVSQTLSSIIVESMVESASKVKYATAPGSVCLLRYLGGVAAFTALYATWMYRNGLQFRKPGRSFNGIFTAARCKFSFLKCTIHKSANYESG
jgi:hypothetical protein